MAIDYDEHFEKQMEESVVDHPNQQMLHPSAQHKLLGAYCREQDKFAMRIVYTRRLPEDPDKIEEKVRKHLFRMDKELENRITSHLVVGREAVLLFDDQAEMRQKYGEIGSQHDGNPFYVSTIHKKGPVLNENT